MKMRFRSGICTGILILLAAGLSACATDGTSVLSAAAPAPYPPPGFAHRVETSHVALYWNCTQAERSIWQLAGVAFNPWSSQPVRFLEFELVGLDSQEHVVSEAKGEARDFLLHTNQSTPFQLTLRTAGSEVRFDLYYQYRFKEGDHGRVIAGLLSDGSFLLAQANRFMARDVCSETQHRVR